MVATRTNIEFAKRIFADRVGNEYVYGGNWNPFNVKVGTDCSGLVIDACDAVRNGTAMAWSRHGMSTESWRPIEVGDTGTIFGTVCVASPNDFPPDAAVKIAIHHGPGGGANSHMWCEVDGIRMESNGSDGCVTGSRARSVYDTSYANDWHYLPGPIVDGPVGPDPAVVLSQAAGVSAAKAQQILPAVADGLKASECTNVNRIAMWLAQVGHESAGFNATEEYASGAAYEGRCSDLGNCSPGDGVRYKGRTWIQITGKHNYGEFSRWANANGVVPTPDFFVRNPTQLAELRYAGVGAAWYWTVARPSINSLCDAGDIVAVTRLINGGTNGLDVPGGRRDRYNQALRLGAQLLTLITQTQPADPLEELLMTNLAVPSLSIYANPGEPPVPIVEMLRALDAHGPHEPYVEAQARAGDRDALARVVRTAAGRGIYGNATGPVNQAKAVLADIEKTNPAVLQAFLSTSKGS